MNKRNKSKRRQRERTHNPRNPIKVLRCERIQDPLSLLWFHSYTYTKKNQPGKIFYSVGIDSGHNHTGTTFIQIGSHGRKIKL